MSRAFVKEAETPDPACPSPPGCGGAGVPVSQATLRARLRPEAAARFAAGAFFCPDPLCEVAYFDAAGERALRSEMVVPAYPKTPGAPLCACFGVAREAIEDFGRRGDKPAMRAFLERTASPAARCELTAADGRSCATEARRVFLRALEGEAGA
jgi:Zinc binding domain